MRVIPSVLKSHNLRNFWPLAALLSGSRVVYVVPLLLGQSSVVGARAVDCEVVGLVVEDAAVDFEEDVGKPVVEAEVTDLPSSSPKFWPHLALKKTGIFSSFKARTKWQCEINHACTPRLYRVMMS